MDISYLLFLQNFRESIQDAWTPFMEWISHFAISYLIIIPILIYWCISKKKGIYIFVSMVTAIAVNAVVKLTACIYRPWIRDARILPAGDATRVQTPLRPCCLRLAVGDNSVAATARPRTAGALHTNVVVGGP